MDYQLHGAVGEMARIVLSIKINVRLKFRCESLSLAVAHLVQT